MTNPTNELTAQSDDSEKGHGTPAFLDGRLDNITIVLANGAGDIEVYWCFPGGSGKYARKVGHWYARLCRPGRPTVGRKVASRDDGVAWARAEVA
jgi:hypothetical protein